MAKKEFNYRGKTIEELRAMSIEDFAGLVGSRAKRCLKRGFDKALMKRVEKARAALGSNKPQKPIRTHKRDAIIVPSMVGLLFSVYKGNEFQTLEIKPEMLGTYLGEYAFTRKRLMHGRAGIGATRSSTAISARK